MSTVKQGRSHLQANWSSLQKVWQNTKFAWRDAKQREFEQRFWREWEKTVPMVIREMGELAKILEKARQSVK